MLETFEGIRQSIVIRELEKQQGIERNSVNQKKEQAQDIFISTISPEEENKGAREVIYDRPKKIKITKNAFYLKYLCFQYGGELIQKLFAGIIIILAFKFQPLSFEILAYFLAAFHFWKIIFNLFYLTFFRNRLPELKKVYLFDIMLSLGMIVLYVSLALYFRDILDPNILPYLTIPHICLTFTRLCVGEAMDTPYLPLSFFSFVESLQFLILALKISNPLLYSSWTLVLLVYYVAANFAVFLMIAATVIYGSYLVIYFTNREMRENMPDKIFIAATIWLCYFIWICSFYFMLVVGFKELLQAGYLLKDAVVKNPPKLILVTAYIMSIGALVFLILFTVLYFIFKDDLDHYFQGSSAKEVSMTKFARLLKMNVKKISESYYRPAQSGSNCNENKSQSKGDESQPSSCFICLDKPTETIIHPCGHSCFCEKCLKEYLKTKKDCPICRKKMNKIYLLSQEKNQKELLAKAVVKVSNKNT